MAELVLHETTTSGESDGETPTEASGRARSQTEGQSDPENHTESIHKTPKSHKRVRRPQMWKKNKLKDWATKRWKRIHFCPWQKGNSSYFHLSLHAHYILFHTMHTRLLPEKSTILVDVPLAVVKSYRQLKESASLMASGLQPTSMYKTPTCVAV